MKTDLRTVEPAPSRIYALPLTKTVPFVPTGTLSPAPSCNAIVPAFAPLTLCAKPGLPSRVTFVSPLRSPRSCAALTRISPSCFTSEDVAACQLHQSASEISEQTDSRKRLRRRKTQNPDHATKKTTFFHKNALSRERFSITGMTKGKATGVISFLLAPGPATC